MAEERLLFKATHVRVLILCCVVACAGQTVEAKPTLLCCRHSGEKLGSYQRGVGRAYPVQRGIGSTVCRVHTNCYWELRYQKEKKKMPRLEMLASGLCPPSHLQQAWRAFVPCLRAAMLHVRCCLRLTLRGIFDASSSLLQCTCCLILEQPGLIG